MLNPDLRELLKNKTSRYSLVTAVAKRARQISNKRIEEGDPDISDPVDVASKEIDEGKIVVVNKEKQVKDVIVDDVVEDVIE